LIKGVFDGTLITILGNGFAQFIISEASYFPLKLGSIRGRRNKWLQIETGPRRFKRKAGL
jgi:hypothetical protein